MQEPISRPLRKRKAVNYSENLPLPRAARVKIKPAPPDHLYPLSVVEEDDERELVKVHYEGFSSKYDEWRAKNDIVDLQPASDDDAASQDDGDSAEDTSSDTRLILPFSLYHELLIEIKASLTH